MQEGRAIYPRDGAMWVNETAHSPDAAGAGQDGAGEVHREYLRVEEVAAAWVAAAIAR